MPWFKVDDRLSHHPKVMDAGNAAMGLWLRCGSWAAANLTDGVIPMALIGSLGGRRRDAERLVKAGLWTVEPDGYRFRDWLDYQPSAHDIRLGRDAEKQGGSFGNHRRWHTNRGLRDPDCGWCQELDEP